MRKQLKPFRFKIIEPPLRSPIRVLDVGCGSHSPTITKTWLPDCEYHGLDRAVYDNDKEDMDAMHAFYEIDLTADPLDSIPDDYFDVIVMSHVIEHLPNGLDILRELARKIAREGSIYIEFPSVKSLGLPSMDGTLHFCDDHTHVRLYDIKEISNVLLECGLVIDRAGTRRDKTRIFLAPLIIPLKAMLRGELSAGDLYDLTGFASFVYGYRPRVDA